MSDISDLFQLDPLSLTKSNIDSIISYYREARAKFNLGEKSAGSTKKMAKGAGEPLPKLDKKDLDDLLNDI